MVKLSTGDHQYPELPFTESLLSDFYEWPHHIQDVDGHKSVVSNSMMLKGMK